MQTQGNEPQGKMFLKVVGILLIIFGGLALLGAIGLIAGGSMLGSMASSLGGNGGALAGIFMVAAVVALISGALYLVVGILGVANAAKPEKAQTCFIGGVVLVAIQVLGAIMNIASNNFNILSTLIGLVLPVLFIIGAMKNKQIA